VEALITKAVRTAATVIALVGVALGVALPGSVALADPAGSATGDTAANPAYADVAAYKQKTDQLVRTPLSGADRTAIAAKQQAAWQYAARRDADGMRVAAASSTVPLARQVQATDYWCGPATASMALRAMGVATGQPDMAWAMYTDSLGQTPWSSFWSGRIPAQFRTGYPIRDVLNWQKNTNRYQPISLSYDPTGPEKQLYRNALPWSIDQGWVLAGNAWEAPGGPHLLGHPDWMEIFHWYAIYGYYDYGRGTYYADSAGFAAGNGYGAMASDTITVINGGRGYIY
jgi:hypothetical protein